MSFPVAQSTGVREISGERPDGKGKRWSKRGYVSTIMLGFPVEVQFATIREKVTYRMVLGSLLLQNPSLKIRTFRVLYTYGYHIISVRYPELDTGQSLALPSTSQHPPPDSIGPLLCRSEPIHAANRSYAEAQIWESCWFMEFFLGCAKARRSIKDQANVAISCGNPGFGSHDFIP